MELVTDIGVTGNWLSLNQAARNLTCNADCYG